jgi:hypothetical protein
MGSFGNFLFFAVDCFGEGNGFLTTDEHGWIWIFAGGKSFDREKRKKREPTQNPHGDFTQNDGFARVARGDANFLTADARR